MKKDNKKTPKVSVVILNLNGAAFLKACIPTIQKQTHPNIEIIVVDNNSTDESQKYVSKLKNIKLIKNKSNYGYTRANNIGVKKATGDYVLILNNDTKLKPATITNLLSCYEEKSILAPLQLPLDPRDKREILTCGYGVDIFGYAFDTRADPNKVFFADGAAIFIKRKDFLSLGGFDEKLFIFQEDIDLSWRAQLYGYKIRQCKKAIVYHYGGGHEQFEFNKSGSYTTSNFRRYQNEKNVIRNILKNYQTITAIPILVLLSILHSIEIVYLLITKNFSTADNYFRAYAWNIKNLKNTLELRRIIQKKRIVSDLEIIQKMQLSYFKYKALQKYGTPQFK